MAVRVLLVDDHAVVLRGLRFFLATQGDIEIVGEAMDGDEALRLVEMHAPDVVLMDLVLPGMDGIETTREIRQRFPSVKVIVLTSLSGQDRVVPALRAGAIGYLLKDVQPDELVRAVLAAHRGQPQLHPDVTKHLVMQAAQEGAAPRISADELTPREREVLSLIGQGRSNKEIAADLGVAETTVKTHVSSILSKLGVEDRTQAAVLGIKQGLV